MPAALALLASLALGACHAQDQARPAPPGELVRLPDGRHLNLVCAGQGAPTVILEGGYAATSGAWVRVQPAIARATRVCAYDRAGAGLSDPGPAPRDGRSIADDLDQALRRAKIIGPYVLVGHSAGALYMRLFSDLRWKEVVGMVLVDPSVEHQDRAFAARFGPGAGGVAPLRDRAVRCLAAAESGKLPSQDPSLIACAPHPVQDHPAPDPAVVARAARPDTFRAEISELDSLWGATSDEIDAGRRTYGDMPLIVLTSDGTYAGAPASIRADVDRLWRELHQALAAKSTRGEERLVAHSSHLMMFDRPDAIIAAIEEVVADARAPAPKPAE